MKAKDKFEETKIKMVMKLKKRVLYSGGQNENKTTIVGECYERKARRS